MKSTFRAHEARVAVDATVTERVAPCDEHVRITVTVDSFPESQPGQFLQLDCADHEQQPAQPQPWTEGSFPVLGAAFSEGSEPLLRRPFSIADRIDTPQGVELTIISRAIGPGTRWLDQLNRGDTLNFSGPLGTGYQLPEAKSTRSVILIGGGVGIPPLLYTARILAQRGIRDVTCIFGALAGRLLPVPQFAQPASDGESVPCLVLPGDPRFPSIVTTDDGTLGLHGRVTDGLAQLVDRRPDLHDPLVLACGPEPMLAAIAHQTRKLDLACQLCIEKMMGCGLGTCLSCVVKLVDEHAESGWRWGLSCTEGPCFERDLLVEFLPEQAH